MHWTSTRTIASGWLAVALAAMLLVPGVAAAKQKKIKNTASRERLTDYMQRAREAAGADARTAGSLWTAQGPFAALALDYKARNVNDLIVVRIVEETSAEAQGSVKSGRKFDTKSGITGLFGQVGARSGLSTLFTASSDRNLDGKAQTASTSKLTTSLAGYVVDALPNGALIIEAAREVEMNNERQLVIVRGIVRPGDIAPDNSVLSTSISNLEVELKGKGVISDGVRPPNKLLRMLLRIIGF
ncbi:MAG: flagellar basal body L-ring protein FlgH [Acidobacteria bacterium]|nr:flagellar basal body L-ring protein FlgH [Acidobacteriota bacterium]MBI3662987.1 flagellar basal body L-ring protein FlgH [Acidobacteriota bacterium]